MAQFSSNGSNAKGKFNDLISGVEVKIASGSESPLLLPLLGALVYLRDNVTAKKPKVKKMRLSKRSQMAAHVV